MVTIKKYSNRRLYDTERSCYLNIQELAELIRGGTEVRVVDAKSGDDLTQPVLLQVLGEVAGDVLPTTMLHRIIRATGSDPWQKALRQQISTGMNLMSAQMDHMEKVFFQQKARPAPSSEGFTRPAESRPPEPDASPPPPKNEPDDLDALRARLAALEERLRS